MVKITVKSRLEYMTVAIREASYWGSVFHRAVFHLQKLLQLNLHLTFNGMRVVYYNVSEVTDPKSEVSKWWNQRNG